MRKLLLLAFLIIQTTLLSAQQTEEQFTKVETMPIFPGCEKMKNESDQNKCTNEKIFRHVQENTTYPAGINKRNYTGISYVRFVIDEEGKVSDSKVIKGFRGEKGELFDQEAIRVVESLPQMKPGTQKDKPVKVQYTLQVKFK